LLDGKTSQGVYNNFKEEVIPKKAKFTQKMLLALDYTNINPNEVDNRQG
jgi:DNA-directed RNA polymerase subunit beta